MELSSGAVRNHDPEIMIKAFELVGLGEDDVKAKFPAMYNAFCYGAPPHAGIAPGRGPHGHAARGRGVSIREVIPFPMNKNAQDLMMGAPSFVEPKQLDRRAHRHPGKGKGLNSKSLIQRLPRRFSGGVFACLKPLRLTGI